LADAANRRRRKIAAGPLFVLAAAAILTYVVHLIGQHSIALVEARRLLPRWDLATHLVVGWNDYHLLATGRIHRLLWDLWLQGYWPPVLSIYQMPFYLVMGGGMRAGLWSSLVAFVLTGITGSAVLWRQWRHGALLPASIFLALLVSSPYLLAYASVTMTETLGAFAQLVVILCYVRYRQQPTAKTARAFAVSLTILFFTKYNYFFLLVVPLVIYEWLERTSDKSTARLATLWRWGRRVVSSPTGLLLVIYVAVLLIILRFGGFDAHLFGRRISVHTIGNTGHVVLYVLLARLWYLHRRRRIDWGRLASADLRIRPLLLWFVLPVTIWFASPYPNHIRDFANLVFNRPLGEATVGGGLAAYLDVLRTSYFYSPWVLAFVLAAFGVAASQYSRQPAWMQWLIVAIPLQLAAIVLHQTRFPRFLLLTVVLLCLVASSEVGRWVAGARGRRVAGGVFAAVILFLGVAGANAAVDQERFRRIAFENYTDSTSLRSALQSIRAELTPDDRLAIIGEGNDASPALFRWELGPPSGVACGPFQLGGAARLDLALTTRVLLMEARGDSGGFDMTDYYLVQRRTFLERVEHGEFALRRDIPIEDLHVSLRLYDRTSKPERLVACE
jgi:hypothetical protein